MHKLSLDCGEVAAMGFLFVLLMIWNMPGTIALRSLLLLGWFCYVITKRKTISRLMIDHSVGLNVVFGFLLFSGWVLIHSIFVSQEPIWSLSEWSGQHPRAWLALTIGVGAGCLYPAKVFNLIKLALFVSLLIHLGDFLTYWLVTGKLFFFSSDITGRVFGQKLLISYIANLYGAFIAADFLANACFQKSTKAVRRIFFIECLFFVFVTIIIAARNGYIGAAFLGVSAAIVHYVLGGDRSVRKLLTIGTLLVVFISCVGLISWHTDNRWQRFLGSVAAGLDGKSNRAWLDGKKYSLPLLRDGRAVDESAYLRTAGLRGAVEVAIEFPLGYGFGRNAYGHAWRHLQGEGTGGSLSGLGDVLVGVGFPGLFIWIGLCVASGWESLKKFLRDRRRESAVVVFIVGGFLGRSVFDANIRDHSLEVFLFLVAALATAAQMRRPPSV